MVLKFSSIANLQNNHCSIAQTKGKRTHNRTYREQELENRHRSNNRNKNKNKERRNLLSETSNYRKNGGEREEMGRKKQRRGPTNKNNRQSGELEDPRTEQDAEGIEVRYEKLKQQYKELAETTPGKGGESFGSSSDNDAKRHIKKAIAGEIWSVFKFFPEHTQKQESFCEVAHDSLVRKGLEVGDRKDWAKQNLAIVSGSVNEHRNYVVSAMKAACKRYYERNNKKLPSEADILACATRDIDLEDEKQCALHNWHWNELLPTIPGNANDWHEDTRCYGTISESEAKDGSGRPVVPAPSEAFAALACENYSGTWKNQ
jgi:hypothetical protein